MFCFALRSLYHYPVGVGSVGDYPVAIMLSFAFADLYFLSVRCLLLFAFAPDTIVDVLI